MTSISQLRTTICLVLMGSVGTSSVVSAESQINGQVDPNQRIDAFIQEIAKQRDELDALQREVVLQRARFNTLSRELHTGLAAQRGRGASGFGGSSAGNTTLRQISRPNFGPGNF